MATYKSIRYIVPTEAVEHTDSINALNDVDTNTTAPTDGQILKWNNTNSKWYPGDVEESSSNATQKGIIAFGEDENYSLVSSKHLISSTGVIASATTGAGTARAEVIATGYGGDKGIFFGGWVLETGYVTVAKSNLVSNTGVVATDVSNSSISARHGAHGVPIGYAGKAVFIFGRNTDDTINPIPNYGKNIVSNTGVIGSDESNASGQTSRYAGASTSYGGDKGVIMGGNNSSGSVNSGVSNLISNTGVIASDVSHVSEEIHMDTSKSTEPMYNKNCNAAGTTYGSDGKAVFFGGGGDDWAMEYEYSLLSAIHLVSNVGVVASNTTQTTDQGSSSMLSGCSYGGDKGIFAHGNFKQVYPGGYADDFLSKQNLVSNTGVISNQSTCAGARTNGDACGYSSTA